MRVASIFDRISKINEAQIKEMSLKFALDFKICNAYEAAKVSIIDSGMQQSGGECM